MKVLERAIVVRIKKKVNIDGIQFGFSARKVSTDAIFIVRQMQERYMLQRRNCV